jgi:V-type H+-transporting ATPase subunit a
MLLPARYLFTLMGFFALYCGFLYNDFASLRLNLFGSCYDLDKMDPSNFKVKKTNDCVYSFGNLYSSIF